MDGLPGVIISDDDFGVNAAGIMVTETTITQFEGWDPAGKPEFVRARKALQYSRSIDDFVRIMLDGNNGGYANDWLIGDNKTGEIAPARAGTQEPFELAATKDGCFVGANFPVTDKVSKEETKFDHAKQESPPQCPQGRWERLMAEHKGKIDVEARQGVRERRLRRDHAEERGRTSGPSAAGSRSRRAASPSGTGAVLPGGTVQSKVIDGTLADQAGLLGPDRPPRLRLHRRRRSSRNTKNTNGCAGSQGHEVRAVEPVRGGDEVTVGDHCR